MFSNKSFLSSVHFRYLLVSLLTFILGISLHTISDTNKKTDFSETREFDKRYSLINPLLECDSANFSSETGLVPIRRTINQSIETQVNSGNISFASVYYRDLNNGPWIGVNEKELFSPASLIKVPLMITYFKKAESNPKILDQELINTQTYDPREQNMIPSVTLEPNQKYTIRDLIRRMIVYSDNMAYDLLNENTPATDLVQTYNDLGVDISKGFEDPTGNILSVKSYASFFRILYNSSYLNSEYSNEALKLLTQVEFTKGISGGIPGDVTIAHKFGERNYMNTGEKQLHDCGIIYKSNSPYLLCVMTRGKKFDDMTKSIRLISKNVYDTLKTN